MADTLRELAEQHSELLTRECECLLRSSLRIAALMCVACSGSGRRLATLEELLEADRMMLWYEHGWCAESEAESREVHAFTTPWEAAARLLVELEAARG